MMGYALRDFNHTLTTDNMYNEPNEKRIESQRNRLETGVSDEQKNNEFFVEWIAYQFWSFFFHCVSMRE